MAPIRPAPNWAILIMGPPRPGAPWPPSGSGSIRKTASRSRCSGELSHRSEAFSRETNQDHTSGRRIPRRSLRGSRAIFAALPLQETARMAEAFICDAVRTPIGRFGGALAQVRTDDLGTVPLKALMERNPKVDWQALDEVLYGCVNQAG